MYIEKNYQKKKKKKKWYLVPKMVIDLPFEGNRENKMEESSIGGK